MLDGVVRGGCVVTVVFIQIQQLRSDVPQKDGKVLGSRQLFHPAWHVLCAALLCTESEGFGWALLELFLSILILCISG